MTPQLHLENKLKNKLKRYQKLK